MAFTIIGTQPHIQVDSATPEGEHRVNENMYGLVRQYIPKNRELTSVTNDELEHIMIKINHRPRKCLDFMSPFEEFFDLYVALAS
jgi:IS30 family transposase